MATSYTPRSPLATAGSAALAGTAPAVLGPGGCPFEVTMPRWLQKKEEDPASRYGPELKPFVVLVCGGPGAETSTHCERVAEEFHYTHLNMGNVLREELLRPDSEYRPVIEDHITQGQLVPDEVTVQVLLNAMEKHEDLKHAKFVIDGFPRVASQMEAFNKMIGSKVVLSNCLYFDCSQATRLKRLREQRRGDDNMEAIQQRIAAFCEGAATVQRYFQYEGMLERIDANRDLEKVWHDVQAWFVVQSHTEAHLVEAGHGSPFKAVWKLRDKQVEEIFPTGHSHTSTSFTKGHHARNFTSYTILSRHRDKHTRNMRSPADYFLEPMTLAQEIGWHQPEEGENIGAKGTPRGTTTPRSFYPKSTCQMTRHVQNMYSTNAQHIIRRW